MVAAGNFGFIDDNNGNSHFFHGSEFFGAIAPARAATCMLPCVSRRTKSKAFARATSAPLSEVFGRFLKLRGFDDCASLQIEEPAQVEWLCGIGCGTWVERIV